MNLPDFLSFSEEAGLWGLLVASFISATILPGGSEVVMVALITKYPELTWQAVGVASIGNTLGGMTSYVLGRMMPVGKISPKAMGMLHQYGYWALLFSWIPLFGDALCVAAGWLRFNPVISLVLFAIGKLFRYILVAGGWTWLQSMLQ